ncbi:hypothetical protein [Candidatus Accumulibacter sp. ACC003]|jgi:hypothetical protein|uniref:hypothetical protein n=1 Tax=Candidatus Accumulibacter sp. ACC003 TaxID=2823334 RepID=UPI0025BCBE93|nr:hypothetical protein [Candidatus Accumulibacter sp. ACC003]
MIIRFNPTLLNRNVAPCIAEFVSAEIPDLRPTFPQAEHWLSNHFLNTLFGPKFTGNSRQLAINLLSRAQGQFSFFHEARESTHTFLEKSKPCYPAVRHYYGAIVRWEACFLNLQMFVDTYKRLFGKEVFERGDGSEVQRAYDMANNVKHWADVVKSDRSDDEHTIPLWMSNSGFHTYAHSLTYAELSAITAEVAKTANLLQNPGSIAKAT